MFRAHSPFGGDTGSYAESMKSFSGFSTMDGDDSSQVSALSRPSGKSIYLQRKDYATSINKMMDKFQYRVEHLFTCDLDGKELKNIIDCVERLKLLDQLGRVWGQDMLLEVQGTNLVLTDIETKEELESVPLSDILGLKAVLNTGVFNSLLTVSVQSRRRPITTVFLFQCDDVRADYIERDLSRAMSRRREEASYRNGSPGPAGPGVMRPAVELDTQWAAPDYEDQHYPDLALPPEEEYNREDGLSPLFSFNEPDRPYTETDRNVDILNHILNEIEIFIGRIAAAEAKNAKKKKKKKKQTVGMPPVEEFAEVLRKIKYGFNHLVFLKGRISNPDVPEFVHSLFTTLAFVVSRCPKDLPPTIVAPLLTPQTIRLMSDEASEAEDQLWQSLGDVWNVPSVQWSSDGDFPTYTLQFHDGWLPREVNVASDPTEVNVASDPSEANVASDFSEINVASDPSELVRRQDSPQSAPPQKISGGWKSPRSGGGAHSDGLNRSPLRAKWDFSARNHQELTVTKGELLEVLDRSKQWWKVRNNRGEEGFVPNNILEDPDENFREDFGPPPVLNKKSGPAEVKAWLIDKGFSAITVRCLGVLSGSTLIGMSREELKMVCPEEGGRVFFRLQAVKSSLNS